MPFLFVLLLYSNSTGWAKSAKVFNFCFVFIRILILNNRIVLIVLQKRFLMQILSFYLHVSKHLKGFFLSYITKKNHFLLFWFTSFSELMSLLFFRFFLKRSHRSPLSYTSLCKNTNNTTIIWDVFWNLCLINTLSLMYWNARCNCKLWHVPWLCCLFKEFWCIIDEHSF